MEGNPSRLYLNDNKIDVNDTAAIFKTLMISSEPKPKDLQSLTSGIKIQPPATSEVADSGLHRKITWEQLRDLCQTPSREVSREHISEGQRRLRELRQDKKEKRQKDMMRAIVEEKKKKKSISTMVVGSKKQGILRNESRMGQCPHEREFTARRLTMLEILGHSSPFRVRRNHKLSHILEKITENLCEHKAISFLFQRPVTIKEAPDYFDIVKHPMDLSIIKGKVGEMEYKSYKEFRHDILQIVLNAHKYNVGTGEEPRYTSPG